MNRTVNIDLADKSVFLLIMFFSIILPVSADQALGAGIDCSDVSVNYIEDPEWTHSERLEAMDKAFFESVNRFELCNLSNQSNSSSSSATGSGTGGGEEGASASESETDLNSTASAEMTGTETEPTLPPMEASANTELPESTSQEAVTAAEGSASNGSIPEDIPASDNDDVIAAQIRLAAEIETDPSKKEKLWNEYRKYKGLPVNE